MSVSLACTSSDVNGVTLFEAAAAAKNGDMSRAEQWLKWMEEAHVQPDVKSYGSVINACAQKGEMWRVDQ